ncbi:MAG: RNA methyltransferase [Chitinophagaceae bacterium]
MLTKSQVKYIQSLNEKKFRREYGVFVAEGPKIINELIASPVIEPIALYASPEWWQQNKGSKNQIPLTQFYELSQSELERISFLTTPHQVLGIFKQPVFSSITLMNTITILLDGIQDPGNLGTIIRIADWFGVSQIVASTDSVDSYNPKVVQSTMGSIARVKIVYEDIQSFIKANKEIPLYASTLHGKTLSTVGKIKEAMLIVGNESKGISEEILRVSNHQITIPKLGHAESLNAAVALGIILSHVV